MVQPLKLFNRLVLIAERNESVQRALSFELTVTPLTLFDENLFMHKNKKSELGRKLKSLVMPTRHPEIANRVIYGGWVIYQVPWREGETWLQIAESYMDFLISWSTVNSTEAIRLSLILDGYQISTKDHEHWRRTKNLCGELHVEEDMVHLVTRDKLLDNVKHKAQLISLIAKIAKRRFPTMNVVQCIDDADTELVKVCLDASTRGPVEVNVLLSSHQTND